MATSSRVPELHVPPHIAPGDRALEVAVLQRWSSTSTPAVCRPDRATGRASRPGLEYPSSSSAIIVQTSGRVLLITKRSRGAVSDLRDAPRGEPFGSPSAGSPVWLDRSITCRPSPILRLCTRGRQSGRSRCARLRLLTMRRGDEHKADERMGGAPTPEGPAQYCVALPTQ